MIHVQTMSTYVQMPTSITEKLTKRSKHSEAMTLFAIGTQIKDDSRTASYTEKDIAALFGETERSLNTYISTLKNSGLLEVKELIKGKSDYRYNSYYLPYLKENYFIVNSDFLYEDIPVKLKGILLFLKANCWKGTNYLEYHSLEELAKLCGIGKNDISKYKRELERLGLIKCFRNHLFIIRRVPCRTRHQMDNLLFRHTDAGDCRVVARLPVIELIARLAETDCLPHRRLTGAVALQCIVRDVFPRPAECILLADAGVNRAVAHEEECVSDLHIEPIVIDDLAACQALMLRNRDKSIIPDKNAFRILIFDERCAPVVKNLQDGKRRVGHVGLRVIRQRIDDRFDALVKVRALFEHLRENLGRKCGKHIGAYAASHSICENNDVRVRAMDDFDLVSTENFAVVVQAFICNFRCQTHFERTSDCYSSFFLLYVSLILNFFTGFDGLRLLSGKTVSAMPVTIGRPVSGSTVSLHFSFGAA